MARHIIAVRVGAGGALALLVGLGASSAALADPGPTADDIAAVLTGYGLVSSDFTGSTTLLDAATALADNAQTDVFGGDVTASSANGGAGIGCGYAGGGAAIQITGGVINATADSLGGDIGSGADSYSTASSM